MSKSRSTSILESIVATQSHKTSGLISSAALLLGAIALQAQTAIAAPALTEASRLGTNGIGPVRVGMTVPQAEAASGRKMHVDRGPDSPYCTYAHPVGLEGVSFMVVQGVIERVDVTNPRVLTLRGAKLGDSENRIKLLYPGQIKTTPHPYTGYQGGHYLTFYPKDRQDQNYRVIFETLKGKVVFYRGGRVPAVDAIEGCA